MSRALLSYLLPFVPVVVYAIWVYVARNRAAARGAPAVAWRDGPWSWLIAVALLAGAIAVLAFALVDGDAPGGRYVPPSYQNGQVVPGHVE
ncbi:MAG: hypothetical protein FJX36_02160 [Alphaproteobacteria bacterium]|nr:hypothetical protein [Alphaproteobacteria bacterium]